MQKKITTFAMKNREKCSRNYKLETMKGGSVCAVVVTYNRLELLKENIQSLLKVSPEELSHILVLNNCSTDGTKNWLESLESSRISVIHLAENKGGAGGFSCGLRFAVENNFDWAWMMDDDTIVRPDSLTPLLETTSRVENLGFVCSHVEWIDGSTCKMNVPAYYRKNKAVISTGERLVKSATFVSLLVSVPAVKKVGLPLTDYFIWTDDVEFSFRLSKNGYLGYYNAESIVLHKTSVNYGFNIQNAPVEAAWRFYYQARNETHFRRTKAPFYLFFVIDAFLAYRRKKKRLMRRADKENIPLFLEKIRSGFIDGLTFNPKVEYV